MESNVDLLKITDLKELKALAYDQLAIREQTEQNLRLINGRIEELGKEKQDEKPKS